MLALLQGATTPATAKRVRVRAPASYCTIFPFYTWHTRLHVHAGSLPYTLTPCPYVVAMWCVSAAAAPAPAPAPTPADEAPEALPYPRSISEISNGDHILGFGADLGEDHPVGAGEPLPHVEYTAEETRVWAEVLTRLSQLYPTHACREFLRTFPLFGFGPERVPQLEDLSLVLRDATGWQLRPVAGLLHPRDFLNGLAFKYFHSTQVGATCHQRPWWYIRHGSNPMYTPEPDVCHEVLGHVAMLADPNFAQLAQVIGLASLGATEKEIWHLTKLYWFAVQLGSAGQHAAISRKQRKQKPVTRDYCLPDLCALLCRYTVEFGTVWEDGEVKAFGAGLLSSFGELEWMRSGGSPGGEADGRHVMPEFLPLDPFKKLPKMSYKDGFQKTYFLCSSFQDAAEKLRAYARSIHKANVSLHQ
eukprot:jgi/Mesen1/2398/ME000157S01534